MDFIDELKLFSSKVQKLKDVVSTEEATKNSLILPFFQMLGYDIFNPLEFVPEFTADVGIKKGEKVDYAIMIDDSPVILIEAKWCGAKLDNHDSQLFRYFGTTKAKFGILTNGVTYRFYTDLDETNKMDLTPFMEINLLELREGLVPELKRFQRSSFDVESIFGAASDLKYSSLVKAYMAKQVAAPEEGFVKYIMGQVYPGFRTQQAVEKFKEIVKTSLNQYIMEVMNDRFKSVMSSAKQSAVEDDAAQQESVNASEEAKTPKYQVTTTDEEREAYALIKVLLRDEVDSARLAFRDTVNYSIIELDGRSSKWICRLRLSGKKSIGINENGKEHRYDIEILDDIMKYRSNLLDAAKRFL